MKYITRVNDREYEIEIDREGEVVVDGERYTVDFLQMADTDTVSLLINSRSIAALVDAHNEHWEVLIRGELYNVEVLDERAYRLSQARADLRSEGEKAVTAPMPGVVLGVLVEEGQHVESGDKVVILESMKMENELRANRSGKVTHVHVAPGDNVEKNQALVSIGDEA